MRRAALVLGFVLALAVPAAEAAAAAPPVTDVPAAPATDPAGPPAPGSRMRQPEVLQHKPSGFRLPNVRAQDGAYRWGLMAVGGVVLAITAVLTIRFLRKASRARLSPPSPPSGSSTAGS